MFLPPHGLLYERTLNSPASDLVAGSRNAGPCTTAMSMPHGICWRRVFASWPVVTTGTCAWMREMHARKRFWCRCSQRKREADNGIEPVWNRQYSVSSAVKYFVQYAAFEARHAR